MALAPGDKNFELAKASCHLRYATADLQLSRPPRWQSQKDASQVMTGTYGLVEYQMELLME